VLRPSRFGAILIRAVRAAGIENGGAKTAFGREKPACASFRKDGAISFNRVS
jgi:hypothetical protein